LRQHVAALAAVVLVFLPATRLHAQISRADTGTVLAPGDLVRIDVWGRKELSGEFVVAPDGSITHPLYREVRVAGIPLAGVEDRLKAFLLKVGENNPAFTVYPLLRIFVGGEVRQPNIYTVPPGTTVAQAIALAGGATASGRLDRVQVTRDPGSFTVNLTTPDPTVARVDIRSGDRIMVARRRAFLQDYLAPTASVVAALASLVSIMIQLQK
jgi:polysaccharide export outer membrane protein